MTEKDLKEKLLNIVEQEIEHLVSFHTAAENEQEWNLNEIYERMDTIFPLPLEDRIKIEDFRKQIQGSWDKSNDLIKRRNAIKRAVVLSNATTKVKVGIEEFTVAEAIEMKNTGMQFKKELLNQLNRQYVDAIRITEKENGETLQSKAENYVIGLYGSKEGKVNTEEIENTKKQFIVNNTFELVDPIKVREKIDALEKEISEFETEIDSCLSVSNSLTEIVIEY